MSLAVANGHMETLNVMSNSTIQHGHMRLDLQVDEYDWDRLGVLS